MWHIRNTISLPTAKERTLRFVVPFGLSLVLAASTVIAPFCAFAEDDFEYETTSIMITQHLSNGGSSMVYRAYKIFDAEIDERDQASHIKWASENAKTATLAFFDSLADSESYATWLSSTNRTQQDAHDNAQNAAEFIAYMIANDDDAAKWTTYNGKNGSAKKGDGFADRLAKAIESADPEVPYLSSSFVAKKQYQLSGGTEGYYLVITEDSAIQTENGKQEYGTAPMWVPMGGSLTELQVKEDQMEMTFGVWEDRNLVRGSIADSSIGQDLSYGLTALYPGNIQTFSRYNDTYTFTFPDGITTKTGADAARINPDDFSLQMTGWYVVDGNSVVTTIDVTGNEAIDLSVQGNTLVIDIADINALCASYSDEYPSLKPTMFVVGFQAHLNENALAGCGNAQEISLVRTYTANPITLKRDNTRVHSVNNTTYQAQISAVDKANQRPLEGAGFYIQAKTNMEPADNTYYVQADGSLGIRPYEFMTDANGQLNVKGLDEGEYLIHQNTVPDGYSGFAADTVLTISTNLNQKTARVRDFGAVVSGGEKASFEGEAETKLMNVNVSSGLANVQVAYERELVMPYTGLKGNAGVYALAVLLGSGGLAGVVAGMKRKQREKNQQ